MRQFINYFSAVDFIKERSTGAGPVNRDDIQRYLIRYRAQKSTIPHNQGQIFFLTILKYSDIQILRIITGQKGSEDHYLADFPLARQAPS